MREILKHLNEVYTSIQNLDIQPTRTNIMLLANCIVHLEEAKESIEKAVKDGAIEETGEPGEGTGEEA